MDKIERIAPLISEDDVWWRPNEQSNAIGNLILHLAGSLRFWIVEVAGGEPVHRVREQEFDARGGLSRDELMALLRTAVTDATRVLSRLTPDELLDVRPGFNRDVRTLEAVHHAIAHFALHTGQLIQLAKIRKGVELDLPLGI